MAHEIRRSASPIQWNGIPSFQQPSQTVGCPSMVTTVDEGCFCFPKSAINHEAIHHLSTQMLVLFGANFDVDH